ncbi:hypothetical protein KSP39_PZI017132 [Platanthera zijinensis]|uniref:Uncharacterized protein n=1 Tax=Platanthera zijinensis TaxID=2320716 RepID=A0AAP0B645_9ASPA
MAGRLTLLQSTLAAILLHALTNAPMPISVLNKVNSFLKNFLWSGSSSKGVIHYAAWENVCLPKDMGGLGIKNMTTWRRIIMGRVAARILGSDGRLLARTLGSKYGEQDLFNRKRIHSKIWKTIALGNNIVSRQTFWMIGTGHSDSTFNDN